MARLVEPTVEEEREWREWVASRPESVRVVAERLDPWSLYRMKSTGQRVTVHSFSEDGTVTVDITGEFNLQLFDSQVFGIDPDDLEPCDRPDAPTGSLMTPDQVEDNVDVLRATIRPDLWALDASGKAVRKS